MNMNNTGLCAHIYLQINYCSDIEYFQMNQSKNTQVRSNNLSVAMVVTGSLIN